ncbi:MAG: hypothetical protein KAS12_01350 [Candidatus Aenigmarchaeota archaeon]|nr:hypothetical protein [Candidatus Aenigmarchaeota archaeon]
MSHTSIDLHEAEKQIGYEIITIAALRPSIGYLDDNTIVVIFNILCEYGWDYLRKPSPFYPTCYNNQLLLDIDLDGVEHYRLRYSGDILANLNVIEGRSILSYCEINDWNIDKISNYCIRWDIIKTNILYCGAILTRINVVPEIYNTGIVKFLVYSNYSAFGKYRKHPELKIYQERQKELNFSNWANNFILLEVQNDRILSYTCQLRYCS